MKFLFSILVFMISVTPVSATYEDSVVTEVSNFQQLALQMKQKHMGLLLMFHAEYCAYCDLMDENILSPMQRSGEYSKRIFIRKIQIGKADLVTDFNGKHLEASEIADSYEANFTPILVFLNHEGEEKADRIIGINSIELFSASVDEQIDELMLNIAEK